MHSSVGATSGETTRFPRKIAPRLRTVRLALITTCLTATAGCLASAPVEVMALFQDRALVRGGAGEHLLKEGETSPDGITLLEADARRARVRYGGETYDLTLSRHVSGVYRPADRQRVSITSDARGQYRVRGAINGNFTSFLVDTGASVVVLSRIHAASLGVELTRAQRGSVQTAQGVVGARLSEVHGSSYEAS